MHFKVASPLEYGCPNRPVGQFSCCGVHGFTPGENICSPTSATPDSLSCHSFFALETYGKTQEIFI